MACDAGDRGKPWQAVGTTVSQGTSGVPAGGEGWGPAAAFGDLRARSVWSCSLSRVSPLGCERDRRQRCGLPLRTAVQRQGEPLSGPGPEPRGSGPPQPRERRGGVYRRGQGDRHVRYPARVWLGCGTRGAVDRRSQGRKKSSGSDTARELSAMGIDRPFGRYGGVYGQVGIGGSASWRGQARRRDRRRRRLRPVLQPDQLEVRILEEDPPAGGTQSRMDVGLSLMEPEPRSCSTSGASRLAVMNR